MSNTVFDPVTLPTAKTDSPSLAAAVAGVPTNQKLSASEFNTLLTLINDLRSTVRNLEMQQLSTGISEVGQARFRVQNNLTQMSRNAQAFRSLKTVQYDPLDYGAIGDGVTDDTAAFQAILTALTETGPGARVAVINLNGVTDNQIYGRKYRITKPLLMQQNPSCAIRIVGDIAARGDSGTQIIWDGPAPVVVPIGGMVRTSGTVRVSPGAAHPYVTGDNVINASTENLGTSSAFYAGLKIVTATGGSGASSWFEYTESGGGLIDATSVEKHVFGQAMIQFLGLNSSLLEHFQLQGNGKALYNVWVRRTSASIWFDHVVSVNSADRAESACFAIGDPQDVVGTHQSSEIFFDRCEGGGIGVGAIIKFLAAGNTKNFGVRESILSYGRVAIDHPGEGCIDLESVIALNTTDRVIKLGMSRCVMIGVEVEAGDFFTWATSTAYTLHQLIAIGGRGYRVTTAGTSHATTGPTSTDPEADIVDGTVHLKYIGLDGSRFLTSGFATVAGSCSMLGCSWTGDAPSGNDVVVSVGLPLKMQNCEFANTRTSTALPWIETSGSTWKPNEVVSGGGNVASLDSYGNFFRNAKVVAPFRDTSGNLLQGDLAASAGYPRLVPHSIRSRGDMGRGDAGELEKLREFDGYPPTFATLIVGQNTIAGVTVQEIGQPGEGWQRVTVDKAAWTANNTTQSLAIFLPDAMFRLDAIYVFVKAAHTGVAGNQVVRVGKTSGGNEYLLDKTANSIGQAGDDTGELGATLAGSGYSQGGYIPNWTSASTIYLTMTSDSGNIGNGTITNFSAGSLDLIVKISRLPHFA